MNELTEKLFPIVEAMQKHFSAGTGTYYSDSIFFLSVAMHRIMPPGKPLLSCSHGLAFFSAYRERLVLRETQRELTDPGTMRKGSCCTAGCCCPRSPRCERRQNWSWSGRMQQCIYHVWFSNLPSPRCVSREVPRVGSAVTALAGVSSAVTERTFLSWGFAELLEGLAA